MHEPLIKVENLTYAYDRIPVLENITLTIEEGDFVGFIGPNGSGKTTLIKLLLGLLKPTSGTISVFGQDVSAFRDQRLIGYVPQKAGLTAMKFPITVEEVVGMTGATDDDIRHALTLVGLEDKRKSLLRELSGGQQQRVFIARAHVTHPKILFLDEPTVGIDIESQEKFYALLHSLNAEHKVTLVLVSHDIDVVAHEVKTIFCINKHLVCHGTPKEILRGNYLEQLYGKDLRFVVHGH